jgi:hypothetical protein
MAQDLTDLFERPAVAKHLGRSAVAETVRAHSLEPGASEGSLYDAVHRAGLQSSDRGMNTLEDLTVPPALADVGEIVEEHLAHVGGEGH